MELSMLKYFLSSGDIVVQWNAWWVKTRSQKKKEKKEKETKASSSFQLGPSASAVSIVVRLEAPLVQNKPFKSRHGPRARILQHRVQLCLRAECEPPTLRTL